MLDCTYDSKFNLSCQSVRFNFLRILGEICFFSLLSYKVLILYGKCKNMHSIKIYVWFGINEPIQNLQIYIYLKKL